jgi:hypothetical protein
MIPDQGKENRSYKDDVQLAVAQVDPVGFVADLSDRTIALRACRTPGAPANSRH